MAPPLVQHLVNETDRLQDEIRQLEREYYTLLHKSSIFSESCQRGYNETEDLRRDTSRVEADIREVMGRDVVAAASLAALQESGRLLAGLEIQARTALDEEVKRTREQRASMESSINNAMVKAREVEEKMMKIEAYRDMKELEGRVNSSRNRLDAMKNNSGGVEARLATIREDDIKWKQFKKLVIEVAQAGKGRDLAQEALVREEVRALEELKMMEKRRRMEQQGTIRLDKVSSEVDRMERAICESSPWRMEERFASKDGGLGGRDSGRANDGLADERAMLMSPPIGHNRTLDGGSSSYATRISLDTGVAEILPIHPIKLLQRAHGGGSSSFVDCNYDSEDVSKGPTPPISLALQAPRALDLASKLRNCLPREICTSTQGQQGLGRRSADVEHVELHDVPAHKRQVSTNAQDHVGMRDTMVMPREERDCSQTQGAGSILSQYGNSASMQSTAASPPHYVPPTPRRLGVQLKLSTSLLKKSPSSYRVDQEPEKTMMPSVEATASSSDVAQEQVASARGDQERTHPGKEQLASATGFRSLSFPKLKSLVRPRSIQEPNAKLTAAMVEDRHHTLAPVSPRVEEPESVGVCPTAAGQRQEERRDSEEQSCDVNTVRALPKLNLLDRFGAGLFKKLRDKEVGDNMESEEQIYQQHPSANLKSTSHGSMAGEDSRGSDAFCPFANHMEQSRGREDDNICHSNSSTAPLKANLPMEVEFLTSESTKSESSCFQQAPTFPSAATDILGSNEEDGKREDFEEEGNAEETEPFASASSSAATTPAKRRLPPLNLNPGTSVNDNKREATLKDLLADSSQSQGEHLPSLPKAPRLELRSPERETCEEDGDDAQGANISVPFSIPELEQHGCLKPDDLPTSSSCLASSNDDQVPKEGFFGGGGDDGFNFNFVGNDSNADNSFSFFGSGGGDVKSPDKEKKNGDFFLNFGVGEGDKVEEEGVWNLFG